VVHCGVSIDEFQCICNFPLAANGGLIHYQVSTAVAGKIISHDSATELYIKYSFSGVATCLGLW
jgi:hypothetical protein